MIYQIKKEIDSPTGHKIETDLLMFFFFVEKSHKRLKYNPLPIIEKISIKFHEFVTRIVLPILLSGRAHDHQSIRTRHFELEMLYSKEWL